MGFLTSKWNPIHQLHKVVDNYIELANDLADIVEDPSAVLYQLAKDGSPKYTIPKNTAKILSVTDVVFRETSRNISVGSSSSPNLLTKTLDTTSYPDRAILTLKNDLGYDCYVTSITIDGKRIIRYSGENGELIHDSLKRDDDIRRNGEKVFEVGNEFIVDATQCANIADYWYKFLGKKKHMYAVQIPGCAYWYEVGDWYNFQVGEADTNEYIDTTIEVYAVDVEKTAGGIGTTSLLLREVEESWSKSTLYATRLATGGSPKRRVNRSNIVTVASVDYDGTYDYKCDGTDDDVQIHAAIDYVSATFGGGLVQLTNGTFYLDSAIDVPSNIILAGMGYTTVLMRQNIDHRCIDFTTSTNVVIKDLVLDGNSSTLTYTASVILCAVTDDTKLENIVAQNLNVTASSAGFLLACGISGANIVLNCKVSGITCINTNTSGEGNAWGIANSQNIEGCSITGMTATGNGGTTYALAYGVYNSEYISKTQSLTLTATAGTTNIGAGFRECNKISNCLSQNAAANSIGFDACTGVQQCKSVSNASHYGTGSSQSYADSATGGPCDDTADGGFNS